MVFVIFLFGDNLAAAPVASSLGIRSCQFRLIRRIIASYHFWSYYTSTLPPVTSLSMPLMTTVEKMKRNTLQRLN